MDLKINREAITVNECIFDGMQEQSVELDYILPDYYPDIFKLVKCCVTPSVISESINGDSVTYELMADIRILYCSETGGTLQCISQKQKYTRSLQLSQTPENPELMIVPKTDRINCRAVNQRRISMQCAVSVKIKVSGESRQEVICDIFGMNAQVKKIPIEFASRKISASRILTLSEDIELSDSKPSVLSVVRYETAAENSDKKIVSGKLVVKGEVSLKILYTCENGMETMQTALPYSQVVDMEGLDDSCVCNVTAEAICCDITPHAANDGESRTLKCEIKLKLCCTAIKNRPAMLVSDVYSTVYPCEFASSRLKIEQIPSKLSETIRHSFHINCDDGAVDTVYDAWCSAKNINTRIDAESKSIVISGMLCCSVMIKNDAGRPSVIEKEEAFEQTIPAESVTEESAAEISAEISGCGYTIISENEISVKAEIAISGSLYTSSVCEAITDVQFDESTKKSCGSGCALKLYFCGGSEDVWDIAKRYSTSVSAIMEENNLEKDKITDAKMLLIPIV